MKMPGRPQEPFPDRDEISEFAARLRQLRPASVDSDPVELYYRAGYTAAMAERSTPRFVAPSRFVTLSAVPIAAMLAASVVGPVCYHWGQRTASVPKVAERSNTPERGSDIPGDEKRDPVADATERDLVPESAGRDRNNRDRASGPADQAQPANQAQPARQPAQDEFELLFGSSWSLSALANWGRRLLGDDADPVTTRQASTTWTSFTAASYSNHDPWSFLDSPRNASLRQPSPKVSDSKSESDIDAVPRRRDGPPSLRANEWHRLEELVQEGIVNTPISNRVR